MFGLLGVVILLVLLWAAKRSRARGILNVAQQRLSGALTVLIGALLLVRGDWGSDSGSDFSDFICWVRRCLGRSAH